MIPAFRHLEDGQDIVEYVLLAGFLSIVAILVLHALGPLLNDLYELVVDAFSAKAKCCD